ncbi:Sec-independent protein translocase subunit TatB [Thalassomonas viridans]|uniref:Sec-independent protein translocase protein TatB n=1 Tax=Thalassomonas viridans TaxID=137584 RepID=A0AAF0CA40_9GAMM|nr:Sec-independent protein translocase protein TatB [Thalassomonas viridans]WDE05474.1 Sec-independent protein translocase subunit TatB [Thalassomonas viridans]
MFDIGFWELILISVIGLLVLGPERLPVAIRTVRSWIAGVRRFSDNVKSELTEELRIQELHNNLKKAEQSNLKDLSPEVAESLKSLQDAAQMVTRPYQKQEGGDTGPAAQENVSAPEQQAAAVNEAPPAAPGQATLSGAVPGPEVAPGSSSGSSLDSSLDKEKQTP